MSWNIPTKLEADIHNGLAEYRTFQTGMGGQTVMRVPPNAYIVIFGMDYQPGGGGYTRVDQYNQATGNFQDTGGMNPFMTQQVSFWTGNQFYPFIFHVPYASAAPFASTVAGQMLVVKSLDITSIARSLYIPSTNDVTITVGYIQRVNANTVAAIPETTATPLGITYGGSGLTLNVQSDFNPTAGQTTQFLQPNPELFNTMGFGIPPAGQSDQAFAKPDQNEGLDDIGRLFGGFGGDFRIQASNNYFLTLHYALYNSAPNEQLV